MRLVVKTPNVCLNCILFLNCIYNMNICYITMGLRENISNCDKIYLKSVEIYIDRILYKLLVIDR